MKLMYLGLAGTLFLLVPASAPTTVVAQSNIYDQGALFEKERVEVVYLPNNTCYVDVAAPSTVNQYKDYVRACLNNHHLRTKIRPHLPN